MEDPVELEAYVEGIIYAFDPRDELEDVVVGSIAHRFVQLRRVARLESDGLALAGTLASEERRHALADAELVENRVALARALADVASGAEVGEDPFDYRALTEFVEEQLGVGRETPALWNDHPLETNDDWEWALTTLLDHVWGTDRGGAARWADQQILDGYLELGEVEGRALAHLNDGALQLFNRVTTYDTRIQRNLERLLREYHQLRTRIVLPRGAPLFRDEEPARLPDGEQPTQLPAPKSGEPPARQPNRQLSETPQTPRIHVLTIEEITSQAHRETNPIANETPARGSSPRETNPIAPRTPPDSSEEAPANS
jgi:hypothetical protein